MNETVWKVPSTAETSIPQSMEIGTDHVPPIFITAARVYLGVLIIVGSCGSVICFVVYHRSALLKRFRSTAYLKALALSDLCFLLCLGLVWMKGLGVHWHDLPIVCPMSIYLSNTSSFLSAWYVMAMTAEMAATVRRTRFHVTARGGMRLITANGQQKRFSTNIRIYVIAALGFVLNGWTVAVTESVQESVQVGGNFSWTYDCRIAIESEYLYRGFNILDTAVSFTAPLMATVCFNIYIAYIILDSARYRRRVARGNSNEAARTLTASTHAVMNEGTTASYKRTMVKSTRRLSWRLSRKETALASLLAARSLAYIILNVPNYIHRLYATFESTVGSTAEEEVTTNSTVSSSQEPQTDPLWQIVIYLLFYTQFALNFFIYSGRICLRAAVKRRRVQG